MQPEGCMKDTRVDLLKALMEWALDRYGPQVYWMCGIAGTGKSTISHSLCELLAEKHMLGASYFCSRSSEETNNATRIIPTIASMIAGWSPPVMAHLLELLDEDRDLARSRRPREQLEHLIARPLRSSIVCTDTSMAYKIVVIDGLDECSDMIAVGQLVTAILKGVSSIPIKIFISSRDEHWIRKPFEEAKTLDIFQLHEIEKDIVQGDIKTYISRSLSQISDLDEQHLVALQRQVSILVKRADRLFIYAAIVMRVVGDGTWGWENRLNQIIDNAKMSDSSDSTARLDELYNDILSQAFRPKTRFQNEGLIIRELLSATVFLWYPLSAFGIAALLGRERSDINSALQTVKSVLHVPSNTAGSISPFHASFPDFVQSSQRHSKRPNVTSF